MCRDRDCAVIRVRVVLGWNEQKSRAPFGDDFGETPGYSIAIMEQNMGHALVRKAHEKSVRWVQAEHMQSRARFVATALSPSKFVRGG